jgi:NADH-quinone oxidoreductase subunit N
VANGIAILPALILAIAGAAILGVGRAFPSSRLSAFLCWLALLAAAAVFAVARPEPAPEPPARPPVSAVTLDSLSRGTAGMALVLGAICVVLIGQTSSARAVRLAVVSFSLAGLLLACVANDFVLLIIGVPVSALAIGAGTFFEAKTSEERSAAVLSLVLNVLGAVCLVSGALLVSGLAGTTNLTDLQMLPSHAGAAIDHLAARGSRAVPLAWEVGSVLLLAGFGIPLLAAPFQLAAAEIFEGSSPWSLASLTVLPRCAVLVAMIRVFVQGMPRSYSSAQTALTAMALVTLLIGGSLAYWQTSFRRLLALLVMVQAGLILLALAAACSEAARPDAVRWIDAQIPGGAGAAWLLFGVDSLAILGLAAILNGLERSGERVDDIEDVIRLLRGDRAIAAGVVVLLLSLCGIPPLPGFWTRVVVLRSVLSVSFGAENDFLPHQNTGYVLFALLTAAALIAVAAPCLIIATRLLVTETPREAGDGDSAALKRMGTRGGLRFGAAIAALVVAIGFVPNLGLHLAARVTFRKPGDAVLAAEKTPPKKHRRARAAEPQ